MSLCLQDQMWDYRCDVKTNMNGLISSINCQKDCDCSPVLHYHWAIDTNGTYNMWFRRGIINITALWFQFIFLPPL